MRRLARQAAALGAVAVLGIGASGCGSSKPGYCADRSRLESSIKEINVSGGVSGIEAQLRTIQSNANALIASARSDFPTQTGALKSSIDAMAAGIKALPSNPTPAQIATLGTAASGVVTAVRDFADATKSKCK